MLEQINQIFGSRFASPATLINAHGEKDIKAIYSESYVNSVVGDYIIPNSEATLTIPKDNNLTLKQNDTVILHDYWENDDDGIKVEDEDGSPMIVEGIAKYKIKEIHNNETNLTDLILSKEES
jgi:hypothetical protein